MSLRSDLHSQDPYAGFDVSAYKLDLQGWKSEHAVFGKVIAEMRPKLIIEVGSWKGASAVHMARCLKDLGVVAEILCVDTWLGGLEFWGNMRNPKRYLSLHLKNGYPTVYYQFLANVVKTGFQDVITPFPQTSLIAARWLRQRDIQAQLIYIDASHDEQDVWHDLLSYWRVLIPGGIMFGDDFQESWPGVQWAVRRFCQLHRIQVDVEDDKWLLRKPFDWREPSLMADSVSARAAGSAEGELSSQELAQLQHMTQERLLQDVQERDQELGRLHQFDAWFDHITRSLTWRWLARFTIGRDVPPAVQRSSPPQPPKSSPPSGADS